MLIPWKHFSHYFSKPPEQQLIAWISHTDPPRWSYSPKYSILLSTETEIWHFKICCDMRYKFWSILDYQPPYHLSLLNKWFWTLSFQILTMTVLQSPHHCGLSIRVLWTMIIHARFLIKTCHHASHFYALNKHNYLCICLEIFLSKCKPLARVDPIIYWPLINWCESPCKKSLLMWV